MLATSSRMLECKESLIGIQVAEQLIAGLSDEGTFHYSHNGISLSIRRSRVYTGRTITPNSAFAWPVPETAPGESVIITCHIDMPNVSGFSQIIHQRRRLYHPTLKQMTTAINRMYTRALREKSLIIARKQLENRVIPLQENTEFVSDVEAEETRRGKTSDFAYMTWDDIAEWTAWIIKWQQNHS